VRTKPFLLSSCFAASVWLTGCQSPAFTKLASLGAGDPPAAAKSARPKDSLFADMTRPAGEKAIQQTSARAPAAGPALCATCAKCGGSCAPDASVKVASNGIPPCNTCAAQTGSVVVQQPVTYTLPGAASLHYLPPGATVVHPIPQGPTAGNQIPQPIIVTSPSGPMVTNLPPSSGIMPGVIQSQPAATNYGAGVEIVGGQVNDALSTLPAHSSGKNMMTVRFGQANNYQIVVGQVYQFRRTWKLRYTAVESDDKYGGSFTLVGDHLDNLKDGQLVRVEGAVQPSDDRTSGARYQVSRIEVLEPDVK
jgi:hypothetical protein